MHNKTTGRLGRPMRIISTFHDYYDCIQAHGQDQSLLYLRESKEVSLADLPFPTDKRLHCVYELSPERLVVGFCGKLYPLVRIPIRSTPNGKEVHCYTPDDLLRYAESTLSKKKVAAYTRKLPKRRTWRKEFSLTNLRYNVENFFDTMAAEADRHGKLFEALGVPIFLVDFANRRGWPNTKWVVKTNPRLESLEFYRVLDRYTAFQELAMYLGAQAQPEKPIPEVPDKVMIGAKGFDKYSFRKDPTKHKQ